MKTIIHFAARLALGIALFAAPKGANASPVCDALKSNIDALSNTYFLPATQQLRQMVVTGSIPGNLPAFVQTASVLAQSYNMIDWLQQVYVSNGCQPHPVPTPICMQALGPAPQIGQYFTATHRAFSSAILSGNVPGALGILGQVFQSEELRRQVDQNISQSCSFVP